MAEDQAGLENAHEQEQQQEEVEQQDEGKSPKERVYTQAELDRILGKVRKNARYLGRKEAEAELVRQGVPQRQAEQATERQAPKEEAEPKREDFEDYEAYNRALSRYEGKKAAREERQAAEKEAKEKTATEQRTTSQREFKKRAEAVMKEIPDFAEAIESAEGVMISAPMGEAIEESAVGPRILYHLVQHPEEAERISKLSPNGAIREIGKLEARIEAELAAKAKKDEGKDADEDNDGENNEDDEEQDEEREPEADDKGKGKDKERDSDGTFKSAKKRSAPEPIDPGSARSATGSRLPSDKDDIETWNRKMDALEREGRR